jgi:stringent starvation protein A
MAPSRKKGSAEKTKKAQVEDTADGTVADRIRNVVLYSGATCAYSHRVRFVLAEKDITIETRTVDPARLPEEVLELSPYAELPVLVDRGLVLHQSDIIMEYLDERFPHPPLMPVDPVSRAQARLMMRRMDRDWYALLATAQGGARREATKARAQLRDGLASISPLFQQHDFVFGDALTLVDCTLAPLLWRLPSLDIALPSAARPMERYAQRLYQRPGFLRSLTDREIELRAAAA